MRIPLALVAAACLLLAGCGGGDGGSKAPPATRPVTPQTAGTAAPQVRMQNIKFVPQSITVRVGQTVKWTNTDPVAHTVTARSGANFDSGTVAPGATYEQKLTRPGTIAYVCTIHPNQTGTITVTR